YLPNIPEAIVAFLATASLGAIWSSCPPDFGERSVLDRFSQIEPKVLIAVDGYHWGGKQFDRTDVVARLQANLPSLEKTILIARLNPGMLGQSLVNTVLWAELPATPETAPQWDGAVFQTGSEVTLLAYEQVPFDH